MSAAFRHMGRGESRPGRGKCRSVRSMTGPTNAQKYRLRTLTWSLARPLMSVTQRPRDREGNEARKARPQAWMMFDMDVTPSLPLGPSCLIHGGARGCWSHRAWPPQWASQLRLLRSRLRPEARLHSLNRLHRAHWRWHRAKRHCGKQARACVGVDRAGTLIRLFVWHPHPQTRSRSHTREQRLDRGWRRGQGERERVSEWVSE